MYITNTTFTENSATYSYAGIIELIGNSVYLTIVSSLLTFNSIMHQGSDYGVLAVIGGGEASIFASEFSNNFASVIAEQGGAGKVTVDCSLLFNNSVSETNDPNILIKNTTLCSDNLAIGQQATCAANNCEGR